MTEPEIRRASAADAAALAAMYRDAYRENRRLGFPAKAGSADRETVAEWIEDDHVSLARVGEAVVGGVRLSVTDADAGRVQLSRLGVRADRKGEGIGSRLLDHAEGLVRAWGHTTVWLTTPGEHPYLPGFYRERGYAVTRPYPLDFREYDEVVMEKRVRQSEPASGADGGSPLDADDGRVLVDLQRGAIGAGHAGDWGPGGKNGWYRAVTPRGSRRRGPRSGARQTDRGSPGRWRGSGPRVGPRVRGRV
jgi:GNAT superfamily N-acetyltransferase